MAVLGNQCTQPLQSLTPTHSLKELLGTFVPMLSSQPTFFFFFILAIAMATNGSQMHPGSKDPHPQWISVAFPL